MTTLQNKTFDEIQVGDSASLSRTLTKQDIQLFAIVTGDMNPAHLDEKYAKTDIFHQIVGHGMWTGSLFSTLLGMMLPGPGTVYLSQTLKFLKPVRLGETITASVHVTAKDAARQRITLETRCRNGEGQDVLAGEAVVLAPTERVVWDALPLPKVELTLQDDARHPGLLERVRGMEPLRTAVVHPVDAPSLRGAVEAARAGILDPVLVGPEDKIRALAKELALDITPYTLEATPHSHAAAARAVELVRSGDVEALMKGKLPTDELLHAVVDRQNGLRTARRMSHVFALHVPSYPKPLLLTDAAINIAPSLMDKKDIVQNAIDLYHALAYGLTADSQPGLPKVAILSAVETVTEKLPSTLHAAALCKMAERGQITGGVLDGPLAFDNAISREAAHIKGIVSDVAGDADILVVPDIESGNMLYKQLRYFSGAQGAGVVLGARVPIILTSRAGDAEDRALSSALALIYVRNQARK